MIKEAYVSFEVARLLKEKGFDGEVHAYHNVFDKVNLDFSIALEAPHLQKNSQESPLPLGVGWIGKIIKK